MLFNKRFLLLFLVLFIRSLIGLSVDIQVQDRVFEPEIVNSYKAYINTGISCDEKGEVLDAQQKANFIRNIFQWMADFLPNELGNLYANLEKSILYAKLLLDRKSDLITYNIITHDELESHNSICQNFFRDFFEKAAQTTIDQTTRELIIKDAFSLWSRLQLELTTTQASSVKSSLFLSTLDEPSPKKNKPNSIGLLPFTPTLAPTKSIPFFQNINQTSNVVNPIGLLPFTPTLETSTNSRPLFQNISVSVDYPMTDFIMKEIEKDMSLSIKKLENLKKVFYLLEIVEDLSAPLLGGQEQNLFKKFKTELDKKNTAIVEKEKLTASCLFHKFCDFIESLKNQKHIINNGVNLVPSKSLPEDQKNMIKCIIKWRNVFVKTYKQSKT